MSENEPNEKNECRAIVGSRLKREENATIELELRDEKGRRSFYRIPYNDGKLEIPETIDGAPVVAIGERAFMRRDWLNEVVLPKGLVSIGASAFQECRSLTSVKWREEIREVGARAFAYCISLKEFGPCES